MTSYVHTAKNSQKSRPPERTRSRAGRREGGNRKVDGMQVWGTVRQVHPVGDRNGFTINKVISGGSITVADTGLRTTRKPAKTPTDKTTALSTSTRNKENRINTKKRTTTTNQHLGRGSKEGIK